MSISLDDEYSTAISDESILQNKISPHKTGYANIHSKNHTSTSPKPSLQGPGRATSERIPTSTWGSFTIVTVILLLIITCLILNCNRIRRKVTEKRIGKVKRSAEPFSFEKRHKELQEAEVEWDNQNSRLDRDRYLQQQQQQQHRSNVCYPFYPTATTHTMIHANDTTLALTTPESVIYSSSSKNSSISSSNASIMAYNPALIQHNSTSSIKHGDSVNSHATPSVQLRMTLDSTSSSSLPTLMTIAVPQQQQQQQQQSPRVAPAPNMDKALPTFR